MITYSDKHKKRSVLCALAVVIVLTLAALGWSERDDVIWLARHIPIVRRIFKPDIPTIAGQVALYGAAARARLMPAFEKRQISYPPEKAAFVANKSAKKLLIYCAGVDGTFQYVCEYPILGASGHLGPKLREGDRQVPEGIYQLTLEPDTPYHVALRLNYPNASDMARAKADGRENPGSDILIHGTTGSIGCIAMGDQVSEDLFVLVNDTHDKNVQVVVAPNDLPREVPPDLGADAPPWINDLYKEIKDAMIAFPQASN